MSNKTIAISLALVVVLLVLGYKVVVKSDPSSAPLAVVETPAAQKTSDVTPQAETPSNASTKDLSTVTTYTDPSGETKVGFTIVIDQNGVIVDAKTDILAVNDIAKLRQQAFAEGFVAAVKGKKMTELQAIDRVGGSSLTTKAFNDSLATLRAEI